MHDRHVCYICDEPHSRLKTGQLKKRLKISLYSLLSFKVNFTFNFAICAIILLSQQFLFISALSASIVFFLP